LYILFSKYANGEKAVAIYWGSYGILGLNLSPTPTATHLCCIATVVAIFGLLCHFTTKHKPHSLCSTQLGGVSLLWRKHVHAKWHQDLPWQRWLSPKWRLLSLGNWN